jgi:hypothetical protein
LRLIECTFWIKHNRPSFIIVWERPEYEGKSIANLNFVEFRDAFNILYKQKGLNPIREILFNSDIRKFRFVFNNGDFANNNPKQSKPSNLHFQIDFERLWDFIKFGQLFQRAKLLQKWGPDLDLEKFYLKKDSYQEDLYIFHQCVVRNEENIYEKIMNIFEKLFIQIQRIESELTGCQYGIVLWKKDREETRLKFYFVTKPGESQCIRIMFPNTEEKNTSSHHPETRRNLFWCEE